MTATQYRPIPTHLPSSAAELTQAHPDSTATLYSLEVIAPSGRAPQMDSRMLAGWTVQSWPVASLGDLTIQARPHHAATPDDLRAALRAAGFTPLGPVRTHR